MAYFNRAEQIKKLIKDQKETTANNHANNNAPPLPVNHRTASDPSNPNNPSPSSPVASSPKSPGNSGPATEGGAEEGKGGGEGDEESKDKPVVDAETEKLQKALSHAIVTEKPNVKWVRITLITTLTILIQLIYPYLYTLFF